MWEITNAGSRHVIVIFPPCSFESIVERIETAFTNLKWPFVVLDAGVPVHLSDCLPSGAYTIVPKLEKVERAAPSYSESVGVDRPLKQAEAPPDIPPLEALLKEWPPFLKAAVVLWRKNRTVNVNYYDSNPSALTHGYFFVVALSQGVCPRVIGLRVLSKQALGSVVNERDLVYHLNKIAIERRKVEIIEEREMGFLSALPEPMVHEMAIKAFMSKKNHSESIFRMLADGNEQRAAFAKEQDDLKVEKEKRRHALRSCMIKEATRRVDVNEELLKVLVFENDPSIEVTIPGVEDFQTAEEIKDSSTTHAKTFTNLLKEHKEAIEKIHASVTRSDEIRCAALNQLEKTNLALTKRLFWLNQLDVEQQARDEVWMARKKAAEEALIAEKAAKKTRKAMKKDQPSKGSKKK